MFEKFLEQRLILQQPVQWFKNKRRKWEITNLLGFKVSIKLLETGILLESNIKAFQD